MRTLRLFPLLFSILAVPTPLQARWESAQDNKPPVELAGMTNEQLFNEAFDVCVRRALLDCVQQTLSGLRACRICRDRHGVVAGADDARLSVHRSSATRTVRGGELPLCSGAVRFPSAIRLESRHLSGAPGILEAGGGL